MKDSMISAPRAGRSALMMVADRNLEDLAELLLEAGAKLDEVDKDKKSPLEIESCQHISQVGSCKHATCCVLRFHVAAWLQAKTEGMIKILCSGKDEFLGTSESQAWVCI